MNGSRTTPPRPGTIATGERSSLDALNRTIEGLEARIEGLMGTPVRETRARPAVSERATEKASEWVSDWGGDRTPQKRESVLEIVQRQRALNAAREPLHRDLDQGTARPATRPAGATPVLPQGARDPSVARDPLPQRDLTPRDPAPRESVAPTPREQTRAAAEDMTGIAEALVALRQDLKKDIADGVAREMASLRAEIRGLKTEAGDATFSDDIRKDLQKLADSIGQVGAQASPAQADALRVEFDELRAVIDELAREDSVKRMESRWTGVEDRLKLFDRNRDDELLALAHRLDEIKLQIGASNSTVAIGGVEDKLVSVAKAIEMLGRQMQPDAKLDTQFSDLDSRLDEISRAIVASGRTANAADAANGRLEDRLAGLSRQIETLAPPADTLTPRIEALAARIEELSGEKAVVRLEARIAELSTVLEATRTVDSPDLNDYLADISRKIDALDQGALNEVLAERLDYLARRIEDFDGPAEAPVDDIRFDRLEVRLQDIALRLEETHAAPIDDGEALRSLEAQIANLSNLVSQPRAEAATEMTAGFESRMTALEDYLSTSDEYIIEAARQAAEAVMEAYNRNGAMQSPASAPDLAAIASLADDLKVLEEMSRSSEERTARTFEALHDTLVHIAAKLEKIEEQNERAVPAYPERPLRENRTAMPKAASPRFDPPEDPFDDAGYAPVASGPVSTARDDGRLSASADTGARDDGKPAAIAKASLLSGLTKRFTAKKEPAALERPRPVPNPAPSIDASAVMAPEDANLPLEPGSGAPDVKKILERVRAGQMARSGNSAANDAEKADFIAAARRAAQNAADEVDTMNKARISPQAPSGGVFARNRRPIMMAVGAVLLAIMSYPLVTTLLSGDKAPQAPLATIEQPAGDLSGQDAVTPPSDATRGTTMSEATESGASALAVPSQTAENDLQPLPSSDSADAALSDPQAADTLAPLPETESAAQTTETTPQATDGTAMDTAAADAAMAGTATSEMVTTDGAAQPAPEIAAAITVPADIGPEPLVAAAKGGDPLAYFEIGARYTEGRGVKADLGEAAKWYQHAADSGLAPAIYRLANLYEKGTGVPRDLPRAKVLYEQAAAKGNASAMHNLAVMYATGSQGTPDFKTAGDWFTKAANLGVRDSQFNLAILYARGNGVPQDLEESYKWFAVAARDGDQDAAQKRDEVGNAMRPEQLLSAKAKFDAWKVAPADVGANSADVPDTWVGHGTKTATVDMKKAVRNIQAILNNNGFDAGKPDGNMGKKTVAAIKAFQTKIGQEPTGEITDNLVKELLKRNS